MDANKLEKLKSIGYRINDSCGTCNDGQFFAGAEWGECLRHSYVHRKHSGGSRQLSIRVDGVCDAYTELAGTPVALHGFYELKTIDKRR